MCRSPLSCGEGRKAMVSVTPTPSACPSPNVPTNASLTVDHVKLAGIFPSLRKRKSLLAMLYWKLHVIDACPSQLEVSTRKVREPKRPLSAFHTKALGSLMRVC